jgi:ATP-dependent Clp protease ATP-binding subunit ClpA
VVQKEVRDPLTDEILFGTLEHGGTVTIGVADDRLAFSCERRVRSGESTMKEDVDDA